MIVKMFAVYDSKAEAYFPPFYSQNNASAIRDFTDKVNTPNHIWNRHPEDYSLFAVGEFDDQTAVILPFKTHFPLGKGLEYVSQPK